MASSTTRLAPSPTGALHLGNARTFVVNWALARQQGWRIILRIEDLDTPRVKPGVIEETVETLRWLGLTWDEEAPLQSSDLTPYARAMKQLAANELVFPCALSRSEIAAAASAPQEGDAENRYDPSLRPGVFPTTFEDTGTNWRLLVPAGEVPVREVFDERQHSDPARSVGDFIVWTQRGHPSYQLAVTVDDERQGVTHIVRGNDLFDSAARQTLIRRALGIEQEPQHIHLPLVRGEDGRRLAKRHGDTRIGAYRDRGVPRERVLGLIARWCGMGEHDSLTPEAFAEGFRLDRMPREDVIFTAEDDRWLVHGVDRSH